MNMNKYKYYKYNTNRALNVSQYAGNHNYRYSKELLTVPHCKTMLGKRQFSLAAPSFWNVQFAFKFENGL